MLTSLQKENVYELKACISKLEHVRFYNVNSKITETYLNNAISAIEMAITSIEQDKD